MSYEDDVEEAHVSVGVVLPVKLWPVWFHKVSPSHGDVSVGATVTGDDQSYLMYRCGLSPSLTASEEWKVTESTPLLAEYAPFCDRAVRAKSSESGPLLSRYC